MRAEFCSGNLKKNTTWKS